jgi:type I pantothenate kinase
VDSLVEVVEARASLAPAPFLVGIGGGVAVGKSTLARRLADALAPRAVAIVATDGFLLSTAELDRRGLLMRKGFPETYDAEAVRSFLATVRGGGPARVPRYSHLVYDVLPDEWDDVPAADIVVLEGVHAVRFADALDLTIYLEAGEDAMEDWYVERFLELWREGREHPETFFGRFATLDRDAATGLAHDVWRAVNLVNLRENVAPMRARADVVVVKRPDHTIDRVEVREEAA